MEEHDNNNHLPFQLGESFKEKWDITGNNQRPEMTIQEGNRKGTENRRKKKTTKNTETQKQHN